MIYPSLYDHQKLAVDQLKPGSILCGGVGSGKSLTAITYYYTKICNGVVDDIKGFKPMKDPLDLYIITTAAKRDTLDWERECAFFMLSKDREASINGVMLTVDSWNNIKKYIEVENAFFIFDEQRVIGSGSWVKSFLKIVKKNKWILLTATPGDSWLDYIPVFIANNFYKNRTDFSRQHIVYNAFTKFPKVNHFIGEEKLLKYKNQITITMTYLNPTIKKFRNIMVNYDKTKYDTFVWKRWNPYENKPVKDSGEYCFVLRKIVNSDFSRLEAIKELIEKHRKIIIFYNFNYELDILRTLNNDSDLIVSEYNGHKHDEIPKGEKWAYLIQYISGSEGWNCVETNTIVFYSLNYSFRTMTQAAGRVDRLNTPYEVLYYYYIRCGATIDTSIMKALKNKEDFNEAKFEYEEAPF